MIIISLYLMLGLLVMILDFNYIKFESDLKIIERTKEMAQFMPDEYYRFACYLAKVVTVIFWPLNVCMWIYKLFTSHLI